MKLSLGSVLADALLRCILRITCAWSVGTAMGAEVGDWSLALDVATASGEAVGLALLAMGFMGMGIEFAGWLMAAASVLAAIAEVEVLHGVDNAEAKLLISTLAVLKMMV